jgi:hypothetical protein
MHDTHVLDDVAVLRVVQLRGIRLQRRDEVGDRGQQLVLDLDRLGREARLFRVVCRDERDRFAHVPHDVRREHWLIGAHEAELLARREIVRGYHRAHARHGARGRHVDTHYARVSVRAAQRRSVQHSLASEIAPVQEFALDLRRRVRARSRLADDAAQAGLRRCDGHCA